MPSPAGRGCPSGRVRAGTRWLRRTHPQNRSTQDRLANRSESRLLRRRSGTSAAGGEGSGGHHSERIAAATIVRGCSRFLKNSSCGLPCAIRRLAVGLPEVAADPLQREIAEDRAVDQEPGPEPPLGAAGELPAVDRQVARAPHLDARRPAARAPGPSAPAHTPGRRRRPPAPAPPPAGSTTVTFSAPGPITTVPPPLDRRTIGTASAWQFSTTHVVGQPPRRTQHHRESREVPRTAARLPPRPSSASISRASSRARFSSTVGSVRSRRANEAEREAIVRLEQEFQALSDCR